MLRKVIESADNELILSIYKKYIIDNSVEIAIHKTVAELISKGYDVDYDDVDYVTKNFYESTHTEANWSNDVKTSWHPAEGLFAKGSAEKIASSALSGHNGNAGSAIKSIEFYKNRGGKNLSSDRKDVLDKAVEILQKKNKKEEVMYRKENQYEWYIDIDSKVRIVSGVYSGKIGTVIDIGIDNEHYKVKVDNDIIITSINNLEVLKESTQPRFKKIVKEGYTRLDDTEGKNLLYIIKKNIEVINDSISAGYNFDKDIWERTKILMKDLEKHVLNENGVRYYL